MGSCHCPVRIRAQTGVTRRHHKFAPSRQGSATVHGEVCAAQVGKYSTTAFCNANLLVSTQPAQCKCPQMIK